MCRSLLALCSGVQEGCTVTPLASTKTEQNTYYARPTSGNVECPVSDQLLAFQTRKNWTCRMTGIGRMLLFQMLWTTLYESGASLHLVR
jgi:hypothetical protein